VRLSFSSSFPFVERRRRYSCDEPWVGVLSVEVNQDVVFCQCYAKVRLGSLAEQSLEQLWNAPQLVEIRRDFARGRLPVACQGQLCPPVVGPPGKAAEPAAPGPATPATPA
jgi:hypothetical protein